MLRSGRQVFYRFRKERTSMYMNMQSPLICVHSHKLTSLIIPKVRMNIHTHALAIQSICDWLDPWRWIVRRDFCHLKNR